LQYWLTQSTSVFPTRENTCEGAGFAPNVTQGPYVSLLDVCACMTYQGPYIDGAQQDDILFYPTGGLDWDNADDNTRGNYEVATAFFTKLWPQYGLNSPFHVAYCYESMSHSEHDNDDISKPGNQTTNSDTFYNPARTFNNSGSICTKVFDNRAVLNIAVWNNTGCNDGCDGSNGIIGNIFALFDKHDCCCLPRWIDDRSPTINVANGMMNIVGDYTMPLTYKPAKIAVENELSGYNSIKIYVSEERYITAGVGIRPEHNWSSIGGVWAYSTNSSVINSTQLQQRRSHMYDLANATPKYKYNFGGYTNYHYQSGCSQTMADTLRDVNQISTCQGYNTTYVDPCILESMSDRLYGDFYNFCANINGLTNQATNFCTNRSIYSFCNRMASSILYGFMDQDTLSPYIMKSTSSGDIEIPAPRWVMGVSSPADLWDRLFGPHMGIPNSDVCGPLMTGNPGDFDCPGQRCECTSFVDHYCWCNSAYDNWCPIEWYDGCDGCDEGCQFVDPDCSSSDSNCWRASVNDNKGGLIESCGDIVGCQGHLGENCSTCPQDCGQCCGDNVCSAKQYGEDCNNCPQDCGSCPPVVCGDNTCSSAQGESWKTVPGVPRIAEDARLILIPSASKTAF
jgi:hypothetical protein